MGRFVGFVVGEGGLEGRIVGEYDGDNVGDIEGIWDGCFVGKYVGGIDGHMEGLCVGCLLGISVGWNELENIG